MFDFKALVESIKRHPGAFFVILLVVVVFASAPFLALWRLAKSAPVVGPVVSRIPGAAA